MPNKGLLRCILMCTTLFTLNPRENTTLKKEERKYSYIQLVSTWYRMTMSNIWSNHVLSNIFLLFTRVVLFEQLSLLFLGIWFWLTGQPLVSDLLVLINGWAHKLYILFICMIHWCRGTLERVSWQPILPAWFPRSVWLCLK